MIRKGVIFRDETVRSVKEAGSLFDEMIQKASNLVIDYLVTRTWTQANDKLCTPRSFSRPDGALGLEYYA